MYIPKICIPEICIETGRAEFGISGIGVFEIYIDFRTEFGISGIGVFEIYIDFDWARPGLQPCIHEMSIEIGLVEINISELVEVHLFEICPEMGPGPSSSESTS